MAFGFFRRRQKMVIIIMVVLMVTFLVGMQGFSTFFSKNPQEMVVGTTKAGEITSGDIRQAAMDLEILARHVGLGLRDAEFLVLNANAKDPPWAYAILLAEAKASGMEVSDAEVEAYLGQMGWTVDSDRYQSLTKLLRSEYRMPTKDFHALVARWMMIKNPFRTFAVSAPPSAPRVERLFRDLSEMIELRVVKVPAEKFVEEQAEPTQQQIDELFNKFRGVAAGTCADENTLGFGYRQPDRVVIHYLLISKDVIARVTRVDETEARRHFRNPRNKGAFVKKVPIVPPEQKDKNKDSNPDKKQGTEEEDKPVEYKTVQMTLTEAMPQIMAKLIDAQSQRHMDRLVGTVQKLMAGSDGGGKDAYKRVVAKLTLTEPATAALATRIADVSIKDEPLSSAIDTLAASAGLKAICYPWGRLVSKGMIMPVGKDKKVSLQAKQITLADALERIGKDLKVGPIEWAMCEGFEGILFPLSAGQSDALMSSVDARMFPVSAATTELLDETALAADAVLGRSFTSPVSGGRRVASIAFSAEGLEGKGVPAAVITVGRAGPEMYVRDIGGKVTGRVLWQLSRIAPAHEPEVLTESLKRQVISDFKIRNAFATRAKAFARVIEADAVKAGLATAATASGLASEVTRLFARKRMVWQMPPAFPANDVPLMDLPPMPAAQASRIREYIQGKVFALVPRNVEPPYPVEPRALAVLPVGPLQAVFVVERIDYRPPVRSEFDDQRNMLAMMLTEIQKWNARKAWFSYDNIIKRTDFEFKKR